MFSIRARACVGFFLSSPDRVRVYYCYYAVSTRARRVWRTGVSCKIRAIKTLTMKYGGGSSWRTNSGAERKTEYHVCGAGYYDWRLRCWHGDRLGLIINGSRPHAKYNRSWYVHELVTANYGLERFIRLVYITQTSHVVNARRRKRPCYTLNNSSRYCELPYRTQVFRPVFVYFQTVHVENHIR